MGRRLLLIDGANFFYRSFFAIRNLATREGIPTNAVYGFVRACHQLFAGLAPTHMAVAWDAGVPQSRLALIPEYKAQRPPMPDALRRQYPLVEEFLAQAQIPLVRIQGEEADDVLASLACWAEAEGAEVLVATSDKDMYQIVGGGTRIVPAGKDAPPIDRQGVLEKTGVFPEQIVDWLGLTGDAVDNIAGVPGMGPKTAAKLLQQFGSVGQMWERVDEVQSEKLRQSLLSHRELIERNQKVVKLDRGLECSPGWSVLECRGEEAGRMRGFYERMEFHSLLKAMDQPSLLL